MVAIRSVTSTLASQDIVSPKMWNTRGRAAAAPCAGHPLQRLPEGAPVHAGPGAVRVLLPDRGSRGSGPLPAP